MDNENNEFFSACGGRTGGCSFQANDGALACVPGSGDCSPVSILEAEESSFHDCNLIEATRAIKEILAKIPQDPDGRNLSFIRTGMGTLLAWVDHGAEVVEGAVTGEDDDATIAAALKLKNVTFADAAVN